MILQKRRYMNILLHYIARRQVMMLWPQLSASSTLPYPTLPYPTLPYPTFSWVLLGAHSSLSSKLLTAAKETTKSASADAALLKLKI